MDYVGEIMKNLRHIDKTPKSKISDVIQYSNNVLAMLSEIEKTELKPLYEKLVETYGKRMNISTDIPILSFVMNFCQFYIKDEQ
jgi:hypothetical protein